MVSTDLALKDAMTVSSQLQANLMLLQRDHFLYKMQPKLLHSRQNVIDEIRTAPFDGQLISDSLADSFKEVPSSSTSAFPQTFKTRSFFRGIKRSRPSYAPNRRIARSFSFLPRGGFNSQTQPQSTQRRGYARVGRQRPRRGGGRGAFPRK